MKIVEITGVPGVGKTSLAQQWILDLPCMVICDAKWIRDQCNLKAYPKVLQNVLSECILISIGLKTLGFRRVCLMAKALAGSRWKITRSINVFRNIIKKFAIHYLAYRNTSSQLLLVDEGISHIPFIFATSATECPDMVRCYYPHDTPIIVKIKDDHSEIERRLVRRGHSLIGAKYSAKDFLILNLSASELQDDDLKKLSIRNSHQVNVVRPQDFHQMVRLIKQLQCNI